MKTTMFKDDMLRAVLDLRKTQTRRIIKLKNLRKYHSIGYDYNYDKNGTTWSITEKELIKKHCRYKVGDIVGIKENFEILEYQLEKIIIKYLFDNETDCTKLTIKEFKKFFKWKKKIGKKSKLFMFDSFIRYKIQITGIRLERVQDISESDAEKEGVDSMRNIYDLFSFDYAFKVLWDSIHKKRDGFEGNPLVWVFEFKKD